MGIDARTGRGKENTERKVTGTSGIGWQVDVRRLFFARVRKLAHWQALQNVFFNFISSCYLTKRGEVILKSRIEMIMRLSIPMNYYRNNGGAFGNGVRISEI